MKNAEQTTATGGLAAGSGEAAQQQMITRPDAFELELIEAFQRELSGVRSELYALQNKVRRYDRAFESMFKEELDRRVSVKDSGNDCGAVEIGPLERLKYEAHKRQSGLGGTLGRL